MKAVLLILSLGGALQGLAQQDHFVFIQSEKQQPFYVRMGEKNHSSSTIGHVILSKLRDSVYSITIGFPQNQSAEQEFSIRINRKDRGFELKNLGDKGWALFDLQSLELVSPVKNNAGQGGGGAAYNLIRKNDDFARLMAGVVNDTAVLYTIVMQEKKPDVVMAVATKNDSVKTEVAVNKTQGTSTISQEPVKDTAKAVQDVAVTKKPEVEIPRQADEKKVDSAQIGQVNVPKVKDTAANSNMKDVAKAAEQDAKKNELEVVKKSESDIIKKNDSGAVTKVEPEISRKIETDVTKKAEPAPVKTDTAKAVDPDPMKDSVMNPPALPVISVVKQHASDTGYHMVVVDDLKDSIDIFIPADVVKAQKKEKPAVKQDVKTSEPEKKQEEKTVKQSDKEVTTEEKKIDTAFDKALPNVSDKTLSDTSAANPPLVDSQKTAKRLVMINSDCRNFATSNDVDKLRVKMVQERAVDGRLNAAKKIFRSKCFDAQQVKALSELFPSDEEKYRFLETAYPFVSDTGNFKGLVSLLNDPVYVQRFRKLVRLD